MKYHDVTKKIQEMLDSHGCDYELYEHDPVTTSEEAAAVRREYSLDQGAKALIVKVYKQNGDDTFAMLVVPGDVRFSKEKVLSVLDARNIRFANKQEISEITEGVEIGGIPPWGNIFNLPTYVDTTIEEKGEIIFNAGDRCVSVAMNVDNYIKIVNPKIVDIT